MAKPFGIKLEGIPQAQRFVDKKLVLALKKANEGIKEAGFFVYGEVKESIAGRRAEVTSVDTGRFLNSISVDYGKLQAVIKPGVDYADILEFGTTTRLPRHHFRNTKIRNEKKVVEFVKNKVEEI